MLTRLIAVVFILLATNGTLLAQCEFDNSKVPITEYATTDSVFTIVDEVAEYVEGVSAMMKHLRSKVPQVGFAHSGHVSMRIIVEATIERNGSISNPRVVRGYDPTIDRYALTTVQSLGLWRPARINGHPVRSRIIIPIPYFCCEASLEN